jgi:hypothetical protein
MFPQTNKLTPVLACEDRTLRVLDRSSLLHNIEVDAVPTVLHLNGNEGGETGDEILYGTADGRVGLVHIGRLAVFLLTYFCLFLSCENKCLHPCLLPQFNVCLYSLSPLNSFPHSVRFDVLTAVKMFMVVLWIATLCVLIVVTNDILTLFFHHILDLPTVFFPPDYNSIAILGKLFTSQN